MGYPEKKKFHPKNPEKYQGSYPIICRSSLEMKAFRMMDRSSEVISWASESLHIPYKSPIDKKFHRYFPDLLAKVKKEDWDEPVTYLIEIKPKELCKQPKQPKKGKTKSYLKEVKRYVKNQAKWDAAKRWADRKGFSFIIMTEEGLNM